MKLKKILAVLLSISMLGVLSACGEKEESSSNKEKDEVVTETVAAEEEVKAAEEEAKAAEEELELIAEEQENLEKEIAAEAEEEIDGLDELVENYDAENPEETVLELLQEGFEVSFGENMDTSYDDSTSTYTIKVWQEGFATAVETEQGKEALSGMGGQLETAIESMLEQIRTLDEDANITFSFVSDVDQNEELITIENGTTTFSVAE